MTPDDRVEIPPDAVLRTSGQFWKLILGGVVLPLPAFVLGVVTFRRIRPEQSPQEAIGLLLAQIVLAACCAVLMLSVRCPHCRVQWVRRAFKDPVGMPAVV